MLLPMVVLKHASEMRFGKPMILLPQKSIVRRRVEWRAQIPRRCCTLAASATNTSSSPALFPHVVPAFLLLVVLAAMAHATWNLLAKRARPRWALLSSSPYRPLSTSVLYAPWVIWVLLHDGAWRGPGAHRGRHPDLSLLHLGWPIPLTRLSKWPNLSVYPIARLTGPLLSTTGAFLLQG